MDNQKETNEVKHIPGQNTSSQPQGGNLQNYEDKEKKQERIDALYRSWLEGKRSFLTQVVITLFLGALLATLNLLNSNSIETLNLSQNKLAAYLLSLALFPLIPLLFIVFLNAFLLESSHLQWEILETKAKRSKNLVLMVIKEKWFVVLSNAFLLVLLYLSGKFVADIMFTEVEILKLASSLMLPLYSRITGLVIPVIVGYGISDIVQDKKYKIDLNQ